jgi:hypothetical protein
MRHILWLFVVGAMLASTGGGCTDTGRRTTSSRQLLRLSADDGTSGDFFGRSVAVAGTTAIVGTSARQDDGPILGSAYLFDVRTGQQLARLRLSDGEVRDGLGFSVAIAGSTAVVGSVNLHSGIGSADLFNVGTGEHIAELLPGGDRATLQYGYAVAMAGTVAAIGDPSDGENGVIYGSVYFFDVSDPTSPSELARVSPTDAAFGGFGTSVAIGGAAAIVGAAGDDEHGEYSGAAYLYDVSDPAAPAQIAKLFATDAADDDLFGYSVAVDTDIAVVGAPQARENGVASGAAYLFNVSTGRQRRKLLPADGGDYDFFGGAVAISGNTILVGAKDDSVNGESSGSAYLFDVGTGRQIARLLPYDGGRAQWFGWSVAIGGDTAIVGAPQAANGDGVYTGSAYTFDVRDR